MAVGPGERGADRLLAAGSLSVFLAVLALSLAIGLFIQLLLLPVLMPSLHAGHGLLRGADWVGFHANAVALAEKIASEGWGGYDLRPNGQAPIGITAAIYAMSGIKEPWILLPVHATVFALAATGLFNLYSLIVGPAYARIGLAPLVLFPSSVLVYAQIHKDVWSLAGTMWIVFALLAYVTAPKLSPGRHLVLLAITLAASVSVLLGRTYLLQLLLIGILLALGFALLWQAATVGFRPLRRHMMRSAGVVLCCFIVTAVAFDWPTAALKIFQPGLAARIAAFSPIDGVRLVQKADILLPELEQSLTPAQRQIGGPGREEQFRSSLSEQQLAWLQLGKANIPSIVEALTPDGSTSWWAPRVIRDRIDALIHIRRGYMLNGLVAGTTIDHAVPIRNPKEFLLYLPRALQIGLFAPFPDLWFGAGVSPGAPAMRMVTGVETIVSYALFLGLLALPFVFTANKWRGLIFVALIILPVIYIFTITIPNVGTLYRIRFGHLHMLLGFGVIGSAMLIDRLRSAKARSVAGDWSASGGESGGRVGTV